MVRGLSRLRRRNAARLANVVGEVPDQHCHIHRDLDLTVHLGEPQYLACFRLLADAVGEWQPLVGFLRSLDLHGHVQRLLTRCHRMALGGLLRPLRSGCVTGPSNPQS